MSITDKIIGSFFEVYTVLGKPSSVDTADSHELCVWTWAQHGVTIEYTPAADVEPFTVIINDERKRLGNCEQVMLECWRVVLGGKLGPTEFQDFTQ